MTDDENRLQVDLQIWPKPIDVRVGAINVGIRTVVLYVDFPDGPVSSLYLEGHPSDLREFARRILAAAEEAGADLEKGLKLVERPSPNPPLV